jgi:hypothetical protein
MQEKRSKSKVNLIIWYFILDRLATRTRSWNSQGSEEVKSVYIWNIQIIVSHSLISPFFPSSHTHTPIATFFSVLF